MLPKHVGLASTVGDGGLWGCKGGQLFLGDIRDGSPINFLEFKGEIPQTWETHLIVPIR